MKKGIKRRKDEQPSRFPLRENAEKILEQSSSFHRYWSYHTSIVFYFCSDARLLALASSPCTCTKTKSECEKTTLQLREHSSSFYEGSCARWTRSAPLISSEESDPCRSLITHWCEFNVVPIIHSPHNWNKHNTARLYVWNSRPGVILWPISLYMQTELYLD